MIYLGNNEISVMLGDSEIPAIYCGDLQIYPTDFGILTGITIEDLTWVKDVPQSGGTATADNCSYKVLAHYDSGKSRNVKSKATVTGSLVVPASTAETREYVGQLTLTAEYEGFTDSDTVDVYQSTNPALLPLTFDVLTDGNITLRKIGAGSTVTIQYCKNEGEWVTASTSSVITIAVVSGDKVEFKGNNSYFATYDSRYNTFSGSTATYNAYGNIMSLLAGDDFATATTLSGNYTFCGLFRNTSGVVDASGLILPAMTLTTCCYMRLFGDCQTITKAPELPATTLANNCYHYMFVNCPRLTQAPSVLPATILQSQCYREMFQYTSGITKAPDILATGSSSSNSMMYMFSGCTGLNYVMCMLSSPSSYYSNSWLAGVAATGTFVKNPSATWTRGVSGVPNGWTIIDST